ncbi:dGTPase [Geothermobacter ehrlichii]|uniref:dGTPase n=1 Tax=Geothermobacter ehrlichii TaxID=213224 RepID=A0A5D3WL44_9BACT|nr:deoxyguanosinetriphosphate triphosphohydrolase [Geothermobacter ehrlichii]TYO98233.1 dGTPase [Geothermobacter ehrlichii]
MTVRETIEERERKTLSKQASLSQNTQGRAVDEDPCPVRTCYQVDRDRILHSKSFRRLKYKTQVFLSPEGDHYRTRLTHTLEVSQIARTIARALELNEDLTEAIALGHDLGHTPFGHAGERVLDRLVPGGFRHVDQSLRVVDRLEKDGAGLNLTWEVRNGIAGHSKGEGPLHEPDPARRPATREGEIVRLADIVAYVNHDLDDAIRGGLIAAESVPRRMLRSLGDRHGRRIGVLVEDIIATTRRVDDGHIHLSQERAEALLALRDWLGMHVYRAAGVDREFGKAARILEELFRFFLEKPEALDEFGAGWDRTAPPETRIADFIAGMTDRFALNLYRRLFLPEPWKVV